MRMSDLHDLPITKIAHKACRYIVELVRKRLRGGGGVLYHTSGTKRKYFAVLSSPQPC